MPYCKRCGTPIGQNDHFCWRCGLPTFTPGQVFFPQPAQPVQPALELTRRIVKTDAPEQGLTKAYNITGSPLRFFIWSIVLFFFINIIGTPLAVVAAFYASGANDASCENRQQKLRKSKLLCITATCVDAATLVLILSILVTTLVFKLTAA